MKKGFTLIELLIAATLAAIVGIAILAVFSGGINVFTKLRSYSDVRKDMLFSLEKVEKDLRSASNISEIEFKGEAARITFPALVSSISYYLDNGTHSLVREEKDYSAAISMEPQDGVKTPLIYLSDIKFHYYYYDPKAERYLWNDSWAREKDETGTAASKLGTADDKEKKLKANTPLGVKIELQYDEKGKSFTIERTVFFPLAVSLRIAEAVSRKEDKSKGSAKVE